MEKRRNVHAKSVQPSGVRRVDRIARILPARPGSRTSRPEQADGKTASAQETALGSVYVRSRAPVLTPQVQVRPWLPFVV